MVVPHMMIPPRALLDTLDTHAQRIHSCTLLNTSPSPFTVPIQLMAWHREQMDALVANYETDLLRAQNRVCRSRNRTATIIMMTTMTMATQRTRNSNEISRP